MRIDILGSMRLMMRGFRRALEEISPDNDPDG